MQAVSSSGESQITANQEGEIMKTVRIELDDYVKLLHTKHELEVEKRDLVNMTDALKIVLVRFDLMKEGLSYEEAVEKSKDIQLHGEDEPNVVDVDFDEDEEVAPRPKRKKAARKRTS